MQTAAFLGVRTMMDGHVEQFLDQIRVSYKSWGESGEAANRGRFESAFSAIWPDDSDFYAYKFLRERFEYHIRSHLVNPILKDLFNAFGIKKKWPKRDCYTEVAQPSNKAFERNKHWEFIVEHNGECIAYRYTYPSADELDVASFLTNEEVDHIEVIDWFDSTSDESLYGQARSFRGDREAIRDITVKAFFCSYFGEELYDAFVSKLFDAVTEAKEIIGLKTIRSLSSNNYDDFRIIVKGLIKNYRSEAKVYKPSPESNRGMSYLLKTLRRSLDNTFFAGGMSRALFGESDFAQSFVTAEYLFSIIGEKDEVDYTPVILGYIKAVEQLSRRLMKLTFEMEGSGDLWIKKNNKPFPKERKGEISDGHPDRVKSKGIKHIPFTEDNKDFFDTTMGPLAYFLTDNKEAWGKNDRHVKFIRKMLLDYDKCDRNGYIHESNINSYEEASRIRSNTYLLLYVLLGGYGTPGTVEERLEKLQADVHPYESLAKSMSRLMHWDNTFLLQFAGGRAIKVVRLPSNNSRVDVATQHPNGIRFAKIDGYDNTMPLRDYIESLPESGFVVIDKKSLPIKVWALPINGNPKLIWMI